MMAVDDTIDGATVSTNTLKSRGRASACNMCGFQAWEVGDTKYVVEHWMRRDEARQRGESASESGREDDINWDAPCREHLCPACAVSRGLDYDEFYKQNKNAPILERKKQAATQEKDEMPHQQQAKLLDNKMADVCDLVAKKLIEEKLPYCSLVPHAECPLFVAWNGVLVLAYAGFPPTLLKAKSIIQNCGIKLQDENFGSKWPKSTLAAVFDDAPVLTLEDVTKLKQLCTTHGEALIKLASSHQGATVINVRALSTVEYQCRSLEKVHSKVVIPMEKTESYAANNTLSKEQVQNVDSVVQEWSALPGYVAKVNAPGSRMASYRQPAKGATCVALLASSLSESLLQALVDFRIAIDLEFPRRYAWFAEKSLHCTLRSLDTAEEK